MLFRKHIEPQCAYCAHSEPIDQDAVVCLRRGVVPAVYACARFRYNPLRRVPPRPKAPDFSEFEDADFSLDGV